MLILWDDSSSGGDGEERGMVEGRERPASPARRGGAVAADGDRAARAAVTSPGRARCPVAPSPNA